MQRIAVPMIGAMVSSTLLTLIVIPAVYALIKGWRLPINLGALQHQGSLAAPSMAHWPAVLTSYGGRAALCRESASGRDADVCFQGIAAWGDTVQSGLALLRLDVRKLGKADIALTK